MQTRQTELDLLDRQPQADAQRCHQTGNAHPQASLPQCLPSRQRRHAPRAADGTPAAHKGVLGYHRRRGKVHHLPPPPHAAPAQRVVTVRAPLILMLLKCGGRVEGWPACCSGARCRRGLGGSSRRRLAGLPIPRRRTLPCSSSLTRAVATATCSWSAWTCPCRAATCSRKARFSACSRHFLLIHATTLPDSPPSRKSAS
jgi:hypothetical protein